MSVLAITPDDQRKVKAMIAEARKNCIPWSVLQHGAVLSDKPTLSLDERKPGFQRPESQFMQLGSFRCAFSFEEQPAGICRHLSVSVERKGKVPGPEAVKMIAELFQFVDCPPKEGMVWVEEYEHGHYAVNVVEVAEPATNTGTLQ